LNSIANEVVLYKQGGKPSKQKKPASKKTKKNTSIVVRAPPRLERIKLIKGGGVGRGKISDLECYKMALSNPFSDQAIGAQVPDMFSAPTITYHSHGTIIVGSNASGIASLLLSPNPLLSCIDMTTGSVTTTGQKPYVSNPTMYMAASFTVLAATLASYRVVGCGWKIRNLIPQNTCTGRIIVAPVVLVGTESGPLTLDNVASANYLQANFATGYNAGGTTVGFSSDILEIPAAFEATLQDVTVDSIGMVSKPVTPMAFNFVNTVLSSQYNAGGSLNAVGSGLYAPGTGLVSSSENGGDMIQGGWEAFLLRAEGLPASVANCFEIQYTLHLEGTPVYQSGPGLILPAVPMKTHIDITGHNNILSRVLSQPSISFASDLTKAGLNGFSSAGVAGAGVNVMATLFAKMGMQL